MFSEYFIGTCRRLDSSVNKQGKEVSEQLGAPALKLPDASLLLNSPALPSHLENSTDHSSRVAAAMAESESRKRDLNGSSSSTHMRNKVPRGNLPHSKRVPDTAGGHLRPPQLTGRWVSLPSRDLVCSSFLVISFFVSFLLPVYPFCFTAHAIPAHLSLEFHFRWWNH